MGVPVILVYLGFLRATEMSDHGKPFVDCAGWSRVVLEYSRDIVPEGAWNRDLKVGSAAVKPIIRALEQEIPD